MSTVRSFLCLVFYLACFADGKDPVRLAVTKEVVNQYAFEGKELTIVYSLYNFHPTHAARDVELFDSFSDAEFIRIHGSQSMRWSFIPAASNVTHAIVVVPRFTGTHNFTSATVTYNAGEDSKSTLLYTSAPGVIHILPLKTYNTRFASHTLDWIGFGFIVTPCLLIPYMLWYSSASKYM
ncbi:unnamed protein product [Calicophoron daubneyi]|uniref:Translocon-associated protein subunit beta n=1 Tax=Calicophoron daubneyi TaxID=300641 RepID=A0AAV2TMG2_CALDB